MSPVTERVPCVRSGLLVRVENLSGCSPQRSGRREGSLLSEGMALAMGPMNLRGGVLVGERRARTLISCRIAPWNGGGLSLGTR
jgi:hypothetical protein